MRVIMTGGGTGGHIYPALAIADKIMEREPDSEILYLGSYDGFEAELVPKRGYEYKIIPVRGIEVGENKFKAVFAAIKRNLAGIRATRKEIKRFKPDMVIGTGGYVSLPVIIAAKTMGIPSCIHEQNSYPGRGNLLMAKFANKILMGFNEASKVFPQKDKLVYVGNPVREIFRNADKKKSREKLGIPEDDFTVFSFGGSQGSDEVNSIALEYLRRINDKEGRTLLFGTGEQFFNQVKETLNKEGIVPGDNIRISAYIENMDDYISAADLIIGRAGALSIAETVACGKPAVLIPLSWSVNNHQFFNAKSIADRGAAILVDERNMDIKAVCDDIEELYNNPEKLHSMEEASISCSTIDAADRIYEEIKTING